MIACSVAGARLGYANATLSGVSKKNINRLQRSGGLRFWGLEANFFRGCSLSAAAASPNSARGSGGAL